MKELTLKIEVDQYCDIESPIECQEDFIFLSNHRDYKSINTHYEIDSFINDETGELDFEDIKNTLGNVEIYPVFAYIHSGIALSLGRSYPFDCQFDSGLFGLFICPKDFFKDFKAVSSFIESYGQWLNGEVYYYYIEDSEGEVIDSCGGFIGYEHCEQEGEEALQWCISEAKKQREAKIKSYVKNRVPLEKRI